MTPEHQRSLITSHTPSRSSGRSDESKQIVPDRGSVRWIIAASSFLVNGSIFGTVNSFGILFPELRKLNSHRTEVSSRVALIGSLGFASICLFLPLGKMGSDKLGFRFASLVGACIGISGMVLAPFVIYKIELMYISSLLFGLGSSLSFTSSLAILPYFFRQQLQIVNGFVVCGSCVFTIAIPHFIRTLLDTSELKGGYYVLAAFGILLFLPFFTFPSHLGKSESQGKQLRDYLDIGLLLKNPEYGIWTLGLAVAALGYFIPFIYLPIYIDRIDIDIHEDYDGAVLITALALASGVGRILFCKMSKREFFNPFCLATVSIASSGLSLLAFSFSDLPNPDYEVYWVIGCCLLFGLFDGALVSLLGPIVDNLSYEKESSLLFGSMCPLLAFPLALGPCIAGFLYDHEINYTHTFLMAGLPGLIGALIIVVLIKIHRIRQTKGEERLDVEDVG